MTVSLMYALALLRTLPRIAAKVPNLRCFRLHSRGKFWGLDVPRAPAKRTPSYRSYVLFSFIPHVAAAIPAASEALMKW